MNKKKILLIEDEPNQVMMIKFRLEANNFDFISACDGEEGLKKASEEKPDLILLDLILPTIDGYEVCRRLKQSPDKNIPIIILTASTAHIGAELMKKCLSCGADDYIIKPFEPAELLAKIKAQLAEK